MRTTLMQRKIAAPGTEEGPCKSCGHIKCNELRKIARSICQICKKPIGYEKPFREFEERFFHVECL